MAAVHASVSVAARASVLFVVFCLCGCRCPAGSDSGVTDAGRDAATDAGPAPTCALPIGAERDARVIAVGYKHLVEHVETYATFDAAISELMANVVGPCLATSVPNLVLFPEDALLMATLIGSRGANARDAADALFAYLQIHGAYASAVGYYDGLFPGLTLNQQVSLVVTDTLWRALTGTFARLAGQYGVTLAVTGNLADAVLSSDAGDLAALADPDLDPAPTEVWVAVAPEVYNQTFFFGPDGSELARRRKVYLVPSEIALLQLGFGELDALTPVDLGFTRAGVVISKDAWMPDVLDRLAMGGAALMLQPEAFSGWTVAELPGDWNPDVVMESAWNHIQKYPELRCGAMASLSGNFFELVFDSQSHVIEDGAGLVPGGVVEGSLGAYVGNDPVPGFFHAGAWAIPDPGIADPGLTITERRDLLRAHGESLLPGAGPPNENAYAASHAAADLWLPVDGVFPGAEPTLVGPLALGTSRTVGDWTSGSQAHPAVAAGAGDTSYVVWEDDRTGLNRVYFARSDDGAATWTILEPVAPPGAGSGGGAQTLPVIAATSTSIHVAWQEYPGVSGSIVWTACSLDGGVSWEPPVAVPAGAGVPPGPHWQPSLAVEEASGLVVIGVVATELAPWPATRIWTAISTDGGTTFAASAVDSSAPAVDERNRRNQWSPAVAIVPGGSEIHAGWIDFRDYAWDVYITRSTDGGSTWEAARRADDAGGPLERLHDDVALAAGPAGEVFASWTDLRDRVPVYGVRGARVEGLYAMGPAPAPPASTLLAAAPLSRWLPAPVFAADGRLIVAWQDFRDGTNDAYLAVSADGGATFGAASRLDDVGVAPVHAFAPRIAVSDTGIITAVWLDTRASFPRVRVTSGAIP